MNIKKTLFADPRSSGIFVLSILCTFPFLAVQFFLMLFAYGGERSMLILSGILCPWMILSVGLGSVSQQLSHTVMIGVTILQCPAYGAFLALMVSKNQLRIGVLCLLVFHLLGILTWLMLLYFGF